VEILNAENEQHLRRARADEIVIRGRYAGYMLATAVLDPGVPEVVNELLGFAAGNRIARAPIPREFVGKTAKELFEHFAAAHTVLLAVVRQHRGLGIEDVLTDDLSGIDVFIRQKFAEAGDDVSGSPRKTAAVVNPPDDYVIKDGEFAVVMVREGSV
jgi:voltage-gated potassium channel